LAGNFWIPKAAETALAKISDLRAIIGKSEGSIFGGPIDLKDLEIKNPNLTFKKEDFISLNEAVAAFNPISLLKDTIVREEMTLDIDDLTVVTNIDDTTNYSVFSKSLQPMDKPSTTTQISKTSANKEKSILIKNLILSISTVHIVDERKEFSMEHRIDYRREFHDVRDFKKLGVQLVGDLGKFGIYVMIDSLISSIPIVPNIAIDGIMKIKDISPDTANKTKDVAEKVSSGIGNGIRKIFGADK
jgi:hypothetical protein